MANSSGICIKCKDQMVDPRILPCFHSFCLKCLESSSKNESSPKCPHCEVAFEMPEGGAKELRRNEFAERLGELMRKIKFCDCPREERTSTFCLDCKLDFCPTCHENDHENHSLLSTNDFTKYRHCKDHADVMNLFCEECGVLICSHCLSLKHKTHKLVSASEYVESTKSQFEKLIRSRKDILENVLINYEDSSEAIEKNETKALHLKNKIQRRVETAKKAADDLGAEYEQEIDAGLKEHQQEAAEVLEKLKNIETSLRSQIVTLENQLNRLSCDSIMEAISHLKPSSNVETDIPIYSNNINIFLEKQDYFCDLSVVIGKLKSESTFRLINQNRFDFKIEYLTTNQDEIYVSHGTQINVYKCNGTFLRTSYDCKCLLKKISNLVAFKDMLFVSGSLGKGDPRTYPYINKIDDTFKIIKFDEPFKGMPRTIFECPFKENSSPALGYKLSKDHCRHGNLILSRSHDVTILDANGRIVMNVCLSFEPENVARLNCSRFLASHVIAGLKRCFSVLDDEGNVLYRRETIGSFVKHLFVDEFGLIYSHTVDRPTRLTVLDNYLDFAYYLEAERVFGEICHDEVRNNLLVVSVLAEGGDNFSILSTYQL